MPNSSHGFTFWFTGLSGAGKTTLSRAVAKELDKRGVNYEILDGDVVRENLSKGLSFSREDRDINVARVAWVAQLLNKHGVNVIVAAISPYREARQAAREHIENFVEVFCDAPLEVVEERDVKGLYAKARAGEIPNFTGISDPYEPPLHPHAHVKTHEMTIDEGCAQILRTAELLGFLQSADLPAAVDDAALQQQLATAKNLA